MCEKLDIKSCKDTEKLKLAKNEVYLKGFYEGIMLVGQCAGMKVIAMHQYMRFMMWTGVRREAYYQASHA